MVRDRRRDSRGHAASRRRGTLRIYLGAAPGVGKTFAMLDEGRRRRERGTDVVVGFVETHGRPERPSRSATSSRPRRRDRAPRRDFEEMDLDAVLRRRPSVALVDELAHTNVPGSPPREAMAGRRGAPRRRHRRDLDGQHPAPRIAQRRRRADHRGPPAGDRARRRGAGGRPDRAGRHDARRAAPAHGPRQHLRRRQDRRGARQLLPARATSRHSASWRCCGSPTRSTTRSTTTAPATASPTPGRPASVWSWPSPAHRAPITSSAAAARIAQRPRVS